MLQEGIDYIFEESGGVKSLKVRFKGNWTPVSLAGYQIVRLIGAGANGVTAQARHTTLDRDVAIKVWLPRAKHPERYEKQFLEEIQKIKNLKHKNIASIYDGQILPNGLCIAAYEYFDGIPLKDWLQLNLYSKRDCWKLCADILDAVAYYQDAGIIHGDLHDGNILVSKFPAPLSPCLIDFGTSAFSSKPNQSAQRELYMTADLTKRMLKSPNAINANALSASVSSAQFAFGLDSKRRRTVKKRGALFDFNFEPRLMTQTMRAFLELNRFLIEDVGEITVRNADDISALHTFKCELAKKMLDAPYLDFEAFVRGAVLPRLKLELPETVELSDGSMISLGNYLIRSMPIGADIDVPDSAFSTASPDFFMYALIDELMDLIFENPQTGDADYLTYASLIVCADLIRKEYHALLKEIPEISKWAPWVNNKEPLEGSSIGFYDLQLKNFSPFLQKHFHGNPAWRYFVFARMQELRYQPSSWKEKAGRVGLEITDFPKSLSRTVR